MFTAVARPLVGPAVRKQIQIGSKSCSHKDTPSVQLTPISTSYLSTIAYRSDKYRRTIRRRVIKGPYRNDKTSGGNAVSKRRRRNGSSFLTHLVFPRHLPKILVGANVHPKYVPPPPNPICIKPSTVPATNVATIAASTTVSPSPAIVASTGNVAALSASAMTAEIPSQSVVQIKTSKKFIKWLNSNKDVLMLNAGSIATLTAFSRTDILELRFLSIMGSSGTILYFMSKPPSQRVYLPVLWSSIFVATNAFMVYQILEERNGKLSTPWDEVEELLYEEHFLPYDVTPKQYERLLSKARRKFVKKGTVLIRTGDVVDSVFLVARGKTEACTTLSKRVSAAGSIPGRSLIMPGRDAGAWIGEIAFLEKLSIGDVTSDGTSDDGANRVEKKVMKALKALSSSFGEVTSLEGVAELLKRELQQSIETEETEQQSQQASELSATPSSQSGHHSSVKIQPRGTTPHGLHAQNSVLTYTATEDTLVLEWSHEDLAELLNSSVEFRSNVVRAMTAAVMGKVVNLYTSSETMKDEENNKAGSGWWNYK